MRFEGAEGGGGAEDHDIALLETCQAGDQGAVRVHDDRAVTSAGDAATPDVSLHVRRGISVQQDVPVLRGKPGAGLHGDAFLGVDANAAVGFLHPGEGLRDGGTDGDVRAFSDERTIRSRNDLPSAIHRGTDIGDL